MRPLQMFLLAVLSVSAPGMAQEAPQGAEPGDDSLILRIPAEPLSLNPLTSRDVYGTNVLYYLNGTLYMLDKEKAELKPELAEGMPEISEDKLVWTVRLRKNVKWHDGQPFGAQDVKFSFDTLMNPKVESQQKRSYYADVKSLEAVDDFTVRITYKQPYYFALTSLYDLPLVPKHCFADLKDIADFNTHPFGEKPIGCGPYKMEKWDRGEQIVLTRNDNYWGRKPNLKRIVIRIIRKEEDAVEALKRGEIDLMSVHPAMWEKGLKNEVKDYDSFKVTRPLYNYVGWNLSRDLFKDKKARHALTRLIDVPEFIKVVYYGHGRQVTGPNYYLSEQYDKSVKPIPFDPAAAAKLLAEAGWTRSASDGGLVKDGKAFEFEFLYPSSTTYADKLAAMFAAECKKAGIKVKIQSLVWAKLFERLDKNDFDCVALAWAWGSPENDPYQVWHSSQTAGHGSNRVHYHNEEADRLIVEARREFDKAKRNSMYHRLHEVIYEDQPYTFLVNPETIVVAHKRFTNVKLDKCTMGMDPRAGIEFIVPKGKEKYK